MDLYKSSFRGGVGVKASLKQVKKRMGRKALIIVRKLLRVFLSRKPKNETVADRESMKRISVYLLVSLRRVKIKIMFES